MEINYTKIAFTFSPVLFLLISLQLNDRYEPIKNTFRSQNWSLTPGILLIAFFAAVNELGSHWALVPILRSYGYNPINFEIFSALCLSIGLILVCIYLKYIYRLSIIEAFALKKINLRFVIKVGLVLIGIYILVAEVINYRSINIHKLESGMFRTNEIQTFIVSIISNSVITPIAEEFTYRGLLYSPLLKKMGRALAILVTSLVWTLQHSENVLASLGIFIIGVFLAYIYEKHGTLTSPIMVHSFKNLLTYALLIHMT